MYNPLISRNVQYNCDVINHTCAESYVPGSTSATCITVKVLVEENQVLPVRISAVHCLRT